MLRRCDEGAHALVRLHPSERDYVTGLKRRERTEILRLLTKRSATHSEAPLRIQVLRSRLPEATRQQLFEELGRTSSEKYVAWVRRAIALPLGVLTLQPRCGVGDTVGRARAAMDAAIAGHESAKREVLKLVCQMHATGSAASNYSLGLEGPPGTGKTHFATRAVAAALRRPLVTIPLGGVGDASYLLGSLYVYEGSREGRLAAALVEAGCSDPILYFDEVDKVAATERGAEVIAALIHLVDPSSNGALRDKYFHGIDLDFSRCTFVFSYNDASRVSPILLDRMRRVTMPAPDAAERRAIVRDHLAPRAARVLGCVHALSAEAIETIAAATTRGGMRDTEKHVQHVLASAQLALADGTSEEAILDGERRVSSAFARAHLPAAAAPGPEALMFA